MKALAVYSLISYVLRIDQAFDTIVDTLISQDNVTEIHVIVEEMVLITKQVSVWGKQQCILVHTFDYYVRCNTLDSKNWVSRTDIFGYRRLVLYQTTINMEIFEGKVFRGYIFQAVKFLWELSSMNIKPLEVELNV